MRDQPHPSVAPESAIGKYENYRNRCDCGRFVGMNAPGSAWYACGEFGDDTRYVCAKCTSRPGFVLRAENGSAAPRWCGFRPRL